MLSGKSQSTDLVFFAEHIDIVVLELLHQSELGISLLSHFRDTSPRPLTVLVISAVDDCSVSLRSDGLVIHPSLPNESTTANIITTLCRFSSLRTCFRLSSGTTRNTPSEFAKLICHQQDLVKLLLLSYSNKPIASALNINCGVVKNYMFDLMRLLAVRSRLELVAKIHESSLATHSEGAAKLPTSSSCA